MSFFAIVFALIAEQCRPMLERNLLAHYFSRYLCFLEQKLNAGNAYSGLLAWCLASFLPSVVLGFIVFWLEDGAAFLAAIFSAVGLYFILSLRASLAKLQAQMAAPVSKKSPSQYREQLEKLFKRTVLDCYHFVFAGIFYFAIGGLALAFLYWSTYAALQKWRANGDDTLVFAHFPQKILAILDYIPARFLAVLLALVGDFDGAFCAARSPKKTSPGLLLAITAGALGTRFGANFAAETVTLRRLLGLIWRALILALLILAAILIA